MAPGWDGGAETGRETPGEELREGISVSRLNQMISEHLRREPRLRNVRVTAEVSGFRNYPSSGHWYFSLKDENAAIPCVMFRQNNVSAALRPRDGDQVTVTGYVEMYARDGKVQLYVMTMKAAGLGSLYERFEALKRKLRDEGLFDPGRKRLLPRVPRKVVVITSASGAVLHDILNVSGKRSPWIPIVLIPSSVQGAGAAEELAAALGRVKYIPGAEAVIIGRGGGSVEDLWCFNEEIVARAVAACPVPVVSAVGHETDFSICDYVADVRASTPSNAAEIVFPDREELRGQTGLLRSGLSRAMGERIHVAQLAVHDRRERLRRTSPNQILQRLTDSARQQRQLLIRAAEARLAQRETELSRFRVRMTYGAETKLERRGTELAQTRTRLAYAMDRRLREKEYEASGLAAKLNALSPLKVLDRGYALVQDEAGGVIPDAAEAEKREIRRIRFRDGLVAVRREEAAHGTADI